MYCKGEAGGYLWCCVVLMVRGKVVFCDDGHHVCCAQGKVDHVEAYTRKEGGVQAYMYIYNAVISAFESQMKEKQGLQIWDS